MSVIIVGKPTAGKKGKIIFSCEIINGFRLEEKEEAVSFNSRQFALLETPEAGDYEIFLVQRGKISDFKNYFYEHRNDYDEVKESCKLLSHCSNKLYLEIKDKEKTITDYIFRRKTPPTFSFSAGEDPSKQEINFISKNGATLAERADIVSGKENSGKNSLETVIQETQNDHSIINFKLPFSPPQKDYCFLGTEYRVSHKYKFMRFPPDCRKKSGFLKLEGYSPANIFHYLFTHMEESKSTYFSGRMKDFFEKVVQCNNQDPLASGNICKSRSTPHFIVINGNMIVSDSSAAHYIPDSAGDLHILAPGTSDNYQFSMLVFHDKKSCLAADLSDEQIEYLPEAIDYYIKQVKRKIENHGK